MIGEVQRPYLYTYSSSYISYNYLYIGLHHCSIPPSRTILRLASVSLYILGTLLQIINILHLAVILINRLS